MILGECAYSGRDPGSDARANLSFLGKFLNDSRRRLRGSPRFGIRAENRRFRDLDISRQTTLAARGSVAKTLYFPETISCLALITGESG